MDLLERLLQYGWPTVALVFVAIGAWRVTTFLAHKLFDDEAGLITQWVKNNAKTQECYQGFMARTEQFNASHLAQTNINSADMETLKSAALEGCEFCRALATAYPDQQDLLVKHVDEMERIIKTR